MVLLKTELLEFEEEYLQVRAQIRKGTQEEQRQSEGRFLAHMQRRNKDRKEVSGDHENEVLVC